MSVSHNALKSMNLQDVRAAIRNGRYNAHTAGLGAGFLQANLAIMPEQFALDFMRYCQRNPKPCPLSGVSDTGNPMLTTLGSDLDVRTDIPAYNIYRNGELSDERTHIADIWQDDLVVFALGCSFTFEHALMRNNIPVWHIQHNTTVPMFRSNIDTVAAGPFKGKMAVSMRAIPEDRVLDAVEVSRQYPLAHGAPVYWGDPGKIGIEDISKPDWGDPAPVNDGEIPVFWACGVTPQIAIEQAKLPICITHKPGHMLITDVAEDADSPIIQNKQISPAGENS